MPWPAPIHKDSTHDTAHYSGCSHLTTIYTDSTRALPSSGISGSQCFHSCSTSLVGGNGTVWASNKDRLHVLPHRHSEHARVHHSYLAVFLRGFGASIRLFAEANALDHFSGKSFRDVGVVVLRPNPVPTCQMPEVIEIDGRLPAGYTALGLNLDIHDEAFTAAVFMRGMPFLALRTICSNSSSDTPSSYDGGVARRSSSSLRRRSSSSRCSATLPGIEMIVFGMEVTTSNATFSGLNPVICSPLRQPAGFSVARQDNG